VEQNQELIAARQRAHSLIARSSADDVRTLFAQLPQLPSSDRIRPSNAGLIMVRGRIGGEGARFNLGELPVARAALRISSGTVGIGYVAGRDCDHAEMAALADAMVQDPDWCDALEDKVLTPLVELLGERQALTARKAAATKVDFFTMVRTRGAK
jgi:alpha-D-ribose 1-methylphosphonate 5-triphosphate synthase subunit PhnG